ncbi:MAG: hypothetical protein ABI566_00770 [Pseudolysinimonas sp.]
MTVLGVITIALVAAAWLFRRGAIQYVLGVAAVFPQTAGLLIGDKGFPLFYLAIAVIAVLAVPRLLMALARPQRAADEISPPRSVVDIVMVALVVWAGVISFAGPRIFAGLPVFDPSLGVDVQVGSLTPLAPTLGNTAQWGYLAIAAMFVISAGRLFPVDKRIVDVLIWATVILAGARLVAGGAWPLALVQTMPGLPYQNGDRAAGTFYEPSVLGMYLTAAAAYFGAQLLMRRSGPAGRQRFAALIGLGLVAVLFVANGSGTALVGLGLVAGLGAVVLFVRVARQKRPQARPLLIAGALAVTGAAITQVPAVLAYAVGMVETKRESFSFVARGASNQRSFEIVLDTWGLGVGLGGNRPSSLPLFVVSCLGVPGTALLIAVVVIAIVRAVRSGQLTSVWALLGGLTAGTVAVPDLSTPLIWVALAACIAPAVVAVPPSPIDPLEHPAPRDRVAHG